MTDTATQHYLSQQLMTASPARLVVMLYDRAIQSLNDAIKAIELAKQDPNIKVWPEVYLAIENHDLERAKLALDWLYIHHGVHQV